MATESSASKGGKLKVNIQQYHAIATWTWTTKEEVCGICRLAFDACCPDCSIPGDSCPPVWGKCNHSFHMHCIVKWLESAQQNARQQCPLCRAEWQFKN